MKNQDIEYILRARIFNNIPRILALLDKNRYSSTYGCFDRKYWHYKIIDFPSGMQQELVLPLAYVWSINFPGNFYYKSARIKEYLKSVFCYHAIQSHKDGSLDDYFPYERAYGATAYALAALTEAVLLTKLASRDIIQSFEKTAGFLSHYREKGQISNHLAIASLALINLYKITNRQIWKVYSDKLIANLKKNQHREGWFFEYGGCDLGYQTVTLEFLARRYKRVPSKELLQMITRVLFFLNTFVHPDGSLGGEYGSRNTYNFYPGGFAVLSDHFIQAANILGYFLKGINNYTNNFLEDDGTFGHMLSSYVIVMLCQKIQIKKSFSTEKISKPFIKYFKGAGFFISKTGYLSIFGSVLKGGIYKIFLKDKLVNSDTGFIGQLSDKTIFCQNKSIISQGDIIKNNVIVKGNLYKYEDKRLGFWQMIGLRFLALFVGKFQSYSNLIRLIMQKSLIYSQDKLKLNFQRIITIEQNKIIVLDELFNKTSQRIISLYRSTDNVNTYVITSDSFQKVNLLSWDKINIQPAKKLLRLKKIYKT